MRISRTLALAGLVASLLAFPGMAAAQPEVDPDAGMVPLARQPDGALPLAGTPWRLVGYVDGGEAAVPGPEVAAFIRFGPGTYVGSGGCSRVEGGYAVTGSAIRVRPASTAERSCAEHLTVVQQALESGLRRAAGFEVLPDASGTADELVIYSVTGTEVLRFGLDDVALLDGGEWRLESYTVSGQTRPGSTTLPGLLSFRPDADAVFKRRQSGPLAGSSGCNGIVGRFSRNADVVRFAEIGLTDAPCPAELVAQESAMIAVLDASEVHLELPPDRLVLTSIDTGDRLEFVSQTPTEGTTWWLQRAAGGGGLRDLRVTLRLEEGEVAGEGPCGPYRGAYVSDGTFITFSDVVGAGDDDCSELRTERALIAGLRRSVRIERDADGLAFLDAGDDETLSFGRPFAP